MTRLERYTRTVADDLIKALGEGRAPWQRTWSPGESSLPHNGTTGRPYHGSNLLFLLLAPFSDPRWAGFGQIAKAGGRVRRGERGRLILIMKPAAGARTPDDEDAETRPQFFLNGAHVFNFEQADGLPDGLKNPPVDDSAIGRAIARMVTRADVRIEHTTWAEPCYRPGTDTILMPEPARFSTPDEYRQTLIHELAHATGHPSRMDRWKDHRPETRRDLAGYSLEELRAEMTALIIGRMLGLGNDPSLRNSEAYIEHWIEFETRTRKPPSTGRARGRGRPTRRTHRENAMTTTVRQPRPIAKLQATIRDMTATAENIIDRFDVRNDPVSDAESAGTADPATTLAAMALEIEALTTEGRPYLELELRVLPDSTAVREIRTALGTDSPKVPMTTVKLSPGGLNSATPTAVPATIAARIDWTGTMTALGRTLADADRNGRWEKAVVLAREIAVVCTAATSPDWTPPEGAAGVARERTLWPVAGRLEQAAPETAKMLRYRVAEARAAFTRAQAVMTRTNE